jgi:hypothetical protein
MGGSVEVEHFTVFGERLESVRKAFRDRQRLMVRCTQDFGMPLEERRRAGAKVNGDIEYLATEAAHQLHFCVRGMLEMHTSNRAAPGRKGVIYLNDAPAADEHLELIRAEKSFEKPASVTNRFAVDDLNPFKRRGGNIKPGAHDPPAASNASI